MSEDLETRLQRLEDRDAIHQLFIDYGRYLDAGDFENYASLFAIDGEVRLGPMGKASGRDAIRELMTTNLSAQVGDSFHIISSPQVVLQGDTATSTIMWTVVQKDADGSARLTMVGQHHDQLVREDGAWRIKQRKGLINLPTVFA